MKRANRHQKTRNTQAAKTRHGGWVLMLLSVSMLIIGACSTKNNTAKTRWWHSFNARYNTYYNGSLAFIDGYEEKEKANQDNYTEVIPLNMVGNKNSVNLGRANFDRAIEKSEKAIKLHSIKRRPVWTKNRRKTAKDIEWLNRKEYGVCFFSNDPEKMFADNLAQTVARDFLKIAPLYDFYVRAEQEAVMLGKK